MQGKHTWEMQHTSFPCWIVVLLILFVMPIVSLFTLFSLFAKARVGKGRAKRLEEDARSLRNCKHVYSLLAGTVAKTQPLSRLMQQL